SLLLLALLGLQTHCGAPFFASLVIAAGIAVYQQWLVRDRDPQQCFRAFLNNNYFGAAIFLGLVLDAICRS
ncbi:MAG: 4-hydroxybenzoate octaprenyltransferase, partial [Stenotrophobium sp.]